MVEFVSIAIGVIGIIVGIIYRPRRSRLLCTGRGLRIVENGGIRRFAEEIEIRYAGNPVSRLTSSIVAFWNNGPHVIDGTSVVSEDPLTCCLPSGCQVLRVRILRSTKETIGLGAKVDSKNPERVVVTFRYLEAKDGGVIELLHTGGVLYPEISGTIKGVKLEDLGPILEWPPPAPVLDAPYRIRPRPVTYFDLVDGLRGGLLRFGKDLVAFAMVVAICGFIGFVLQWRFPEIVSQVLDGVYSSSSQPASPPPETSALGRTILVGVSVFFSWIILSIVVRALRNFIAFTLSGRLNRNAKSFLAAAKQRSLPRDLNVWQ